MMGHEDFLLLAAKRIHEPLTAAEDADLEAHLASCPDCRAIAVGMRRDDILLRAQLAEVAVSPRVRRRVTDEAAGKRHFDWRLTLALAATLLLGAVSVPLIAGALQPQPSKPPVSLIAEAPPTSSPSAPPTTPSSSPDPTSPSLELTPVPSDLPTPTQGLGPFVAAAYTLGSPIDRSDTIAAHFDPDGAATGEWTRRRTTTGKLEVFRGPVTCLVIDGNDAWLAGPAASSDDPSIKAAFIHVHDGGADGKGDRGLLRLNNPGETLATFEFWCQSKFIPGGPYDITSGEVQVDDTPR
jgi:Putative zinc-finger